MTNLIFTCKRSRTRPWPVNMETTSLQHGAKDLRSKYKDSADWCKWTRGNSGKQKFN